MARQLDVAATEAASPGIGNGVDGTSERTKSNGSRRFVLQQEVLPGNAPLQRLALGCEAQVVDENIGRMD